MKRTIIKKTNDLAKYKEILETMDKVYTKVNNKVYQLTEWIFFFYLRISWNANTDLSKIPGQYREEIRKK